MPDLDFGFSVVAVEIIDLDMTDFVFSSFPFIALADDVEVLATFPLDFGDAGAGPRWLTVIDRAEDVAKVLPLVAEDDPRPRLEVGMVFFAADDIFCVSQTERTKAEKGAPARLRTCVNLYGAILSIYY